MTNRRDSHNLGGDDADSARLGAYDIRVGVGPIEGPEWQGVVPHTEEEDPSDDRNQDEIQKPVTGDQ